MATNIARVILVIGCSMLIGFSISVIHEANRFRAVPKYTRNVAISYILAIAFIIVEVLERIDHGTPITWRTVLGYFVVGFGLYSMLQMRSAYKYANRMRRHGRRSEDLAEALLSKHDGEERDKDE